MFKVKEASVEELMEWTLACQQNDKKTISLIEPVKGETIIVDSVPDKYGEVLCQTDGRLHKLPEYNAKRLELINRINERKIYTCEEDKIEQIKNIRKLYELEHVPVLDVVGETVKNICFKEVDGINILYCMKSSETKYVKDTFMPIVTNRPCNLGAASDHLEFRGPLHLLLAMITAPLVFVVVIPINIKDRMQLVRDINKVKRAPIEVKEENKEEINIIHTYKDAYALWNGQHEEIHECPTLPSMDEIRKMDEELGFQKKYGHK